MTDARIEFCGSAATPALRARVAARLAGVLDVMPIEPTSARVAFTDENGPKGGEAIRCTLEVRLARCAPVRVEDVAGTPRLAFERGSRSSSAGCAGFVRPRVISSGIRRSTSPPGASWRARDRRTSHGTRYRPAAAASS